MNQVYLILKNQNNFTKESIEELRTSKFMDNFTVGIV